MKSIKIKNDEFVISYPKEEIQKDIATIADKMREELHDKNPVFICVLNGAVFFFTDLVKQFDFPCEMYFIKVSSYDGMQTTGKVNVHMGINETINLKGRTVVIVEDIVDSGLTIQKIKTLISEVGVADLKIATLLFKPEALKCDVKLDYVVKEIPNLFVVGYGLDYDGYGRNYPDIYVLKN